VAALFLDRGNAKREGRRKPQAACTWLLGIYIHHPFRATALQQTPPRSSSFRCLRPRARVRAFLR